MGDGGLCHEAGHEGKTNDWLTPLYIIEALGEFDLDPCATLNPPWPTAKHSFNIHDDGLSLEWFGRVWMNPPYGPHSKVWHDRLAEHGNGITLLFARTETSWFFDSVWQHADSLLFLKGRVKFCYPDGRPSKNSCGAPCVLVAHGENNTEALSQSGLAGALVQTTKLIDGG
jgi:hypothetical protein